jgi:hypothetical protein
MKILNKDTHYLTEHTGSGQKDLAKAVLLRAFLDSVGHLGSHGAIGHNEMGILQDQAKDFINPNKKQFKLVCELADAEPEYVSKLHDDLTYHYNCGKLKNLNTKYVIEKLLQKL